MLRIVRMHATTSFIFLLVLLPSSLARVGNRDSTSGTEILLLPIDRPPEVGLTTFSCHSRPYPARAATSTGLPPLVDHPSNRPLLQRR
jgi:hypothetical protein